jgi:hypothetical protein
MKRLLLASVAVLFLTGAALAQSAAEFEAAGLPPIAMHIGPCGGYLSYMKGYPMIAEATNALRQCLQQLGKQAGCVTNDYECLAKLRDALKEQSQ